MKSVNILFYTTITVCAMLVIGAVIYALISSAKTTDTVTAAPVSPVTEPVVLHNTACHTIERVVDRENGVVCWVDLTCQGVGISCLPFGDLPVWSKVKE